MALTAQGCFPGVELSVQEVNAINVALTTPQELNRHLASKDTLIKLVTPSDFAKERGGSQYDYNIEKAKFKHICADYGDELQWNVGSMAVDFCQKILFEIAPESRTVKKGAGDRQWRLIFPHGVNRVKCLYVATYKGDDMNYESKPIDNTSHIMQVPVKQACLLAMDTLRRVVLLSAEQNPPMYILTPLAGAVFSRNDIDDIAAILNVDNGAAVCMLNDSCQSGGHNLPHSNGTVAVLATVANTRRLAESGKTQEAGSIITKVTKQYIAKRGREAIDIDQFRALAAFANGGVPIGLDAKSLAKMFVATQVNPIRAGNLAELAGIGGQNIRRRPGGDPGALVDLIGQVVAEQLNRREDDDDDDEVALPGNDGNQQPGGRG